MTTKTKRGGARKGAGAPKKAETKKRYNVMLSDQVAKDLEMIGGGNRSTAIEEVLNYYLAHAFGVTQENKKDLVCARSF